jgi:hypothetical protein
MFKPCILIGSDFTRKNLTRSRYLLKLVGTFFVALFHALLKLYKALPERSHGSGKAIAEQQHDDHQHDRHFHPAWNPGEDRLRCDFPQQIIHRKSSENLRIKNPSVVYISAQARTKPNVRGIYPEQRLIRDRAQNKSSYQPERAKSQGYEAKSWSGILFPPKKAPRN